MTRDTPSIVDQALRVDLSEPRSVAQGFLRYERYDVAIHRAADDVLKQQRDIIRGGPVAAVLPIDLARNQIVLLRQFRLAAHLATGRGDLVEIVAGRVDKGESAIEAARRECVEEIGLVPTRLVELFSVLSTPGITDELVTFFVGFVDASELPTRGGTDESEDTRPFLAGFDEALAALTGNTAQNALFVSALQWLAMHRGDLQKLHDSASN
jgi:ADP-ribose pyrophosphatase